MILHIDADTIIYSGAFAAQANNEVQPLGNALSNIRNTMTSILHNVQPIEYYVYLTAANDKTNFRLAIAKTKEYKGNRKNKPKPIYYNECRQYLVDHWGAIIISGREADDAVADAHLIVYKDFPDATCIAAVDKDLNNIPGLHYNYNTKVFYWVDEFEAYKNYYTQMLVGDIADNVAGINKIGAKKAAKILNGCYYEVDLENKVIEEYKKAYKDSWEDRYYENKALLKIGEQPR